MRRLLSALSAAALIAVLASGAAVAHDIIPGTNVAPNANSHATVEGNPHCGAVSAGGFNLKIEAEDIVQGGVYGNIRITYYDGKYVSWELIDTSDHDADVVIVKGGPNAVWYTYDTNDDADTRLSAPRNYNGAQPKYYGISHIQFCFDPKA